MTTMPVATSCFPYRALRYLLLAVAILVTSTAAASADPIVVLNTFNGTDAGFTNFGPGFPAAFEFVASATGRLTTLQTVVSQFPEDFHGVFPSGRDVRVQVMTSIPSGIAFADRRPGTTLDTFAFGLPAFEPPAVQLALSTTHAMLFAGERYFLGFFSDSGGGSYRLALREGGTDGTAWFTERRDGVSIFDEPDVNPSIPQARLIADTVTPEPAPVMLIGAGLVVMVIWQQKRRANPSCRGSVATHA